MKKKEKVKTEFTAQEILDAYDRLSYKYKANVLASALGECMHYNGHSYASYICKAMGYESTDHRTWIKLTTDHER